MPGESFVIAPIPNSLSVTASECGNGRVAAEPVHYFSGSRECFHACDDIPNFMEDQGEKSFLGEIIWNDAQLGMAARSEPPDLNTAHRMLVLRTWAGLGGHGNQTAFAIKYGFTVKQWNNFERGAPLSKEAAFQLVEKFPGLTLDWLHLGKWETLSRKLSLELEAAESSLMSEPTERRR